MSRASTGDQVIVKPSNSVYTVLAIVGTLVNVLGFLILLMRFTAVFGDKANLFQMATHR
jgi:hypothetical protein